MVQFFFILGACHVGHCWVCNGLLVGLTGVEVGAVMTPLLLLEFGVAPVKAVGNDLLFAGLIKVVSSRVHHRAGLID